MDIGRHNNRDQEICSYSHEFLISIAEIENDLPPLVMFHHWNSGHVQSSNAAPASPSSAIPVKVGYEELKLLHGLRDLGSFELSATDVSSSRIHDYLATLIDSSASSDSENISSILSCLQSAASSSSLQTSFAFVRFLALIAHSNSADAAFSGGVVPAWKLFVPGDKPWDMKKSPWKPDLEDLLAYPDWSPKGKRRLLLQGVSAERAEELRQSMVLFPGSKENVITYENSKDSG